MRRAPAKAVAWVLLWGLIFPNLMACRSTTTAEGGAGQDLLPAAAVASQKAAAPEGPSATGVDLASPASAEDEGDMAPMRMEWLLDTSDFIAEVTVVEHLDEVHNTPSGLLDVSPEEALEAQRVHDLQRIVPIVLEVKQIYTPTLATPSIEGVIVRMFNGIDLPPGVGSELGSESQFGMNLQDLPVGSSGLVLLFLNNPEDYLGSGDSWVELFRGMAQQLSLDEGLRYESGQFKAWYTEDGGPYPFTDGSTRSYQEILDYARSLSGGS